MFITIVSNHSTLDKARSSLYSIGIAKFLDYNRYSKTKLFIYSYALRSN